MLLQIDPSVLEAVGKEDGNAVGLIVGVFPDQQNQNPVLQILHLAPTRDYSAADATPPPTLTTLSTSLLTHHTRQLLRMLPGGLNILGIYAVSPSEEPTPTNLLSSLTKNLTTKFANYIPTENKRIFLHYNSRTRAFTCDNNTVEIGSCKLLKVEADFEVSGVVVQQQQQESGTGFDVGEGVDRVLSVWGTTKIFPLFNGCAANNSKYEPTDVVSVLVERLPSWFLEKEKSRDFINHLELRGRMHLVGFVGEGEGRKVAGEALHTDLLRSLSSRLTQHIESLIEEDSAAADTNTTHDEGLKVWHEVPRRVFVSIVRGGGAVGGESGGGVVVVSDYLFPGEGPIDCCDSFREILGLDWVREGDILEGREGELTSTTTSTTSGSIEQLAESITKLQSKSGNSWVLWGAVLIVFIGLVLGVWFGKK